MNPVIHLVLRPIIGPVNGLVHISSGITLYFSYFGTKRPFSNCSLQKTDRDDNMFNYGSNSLRFNNMNITCVVSPI